MRTLGKLLALGALVLGGCGGPSTTGYAIVSRTGSLDAVEGDAVPLEVVQVLADGTSRPLPSTATVTWQGAVVAIASPLGRAPGLPSGTDGPQAAFLENPVRPDRAGDLAGVLFVFAANGGGQVAVAAQVDGVDAAPVQVSAAVNVTSLSAGDPDYGALLYGPQGANCARCHGATGDGSPETDYDDGGVVFTYDGVYHDFPAPPLNANVVDPDDPPLAADDGWNAALLAYACRADADDDGYALQVPMPDYLDLSGGGLSTQDYADLYAFLQTQTQ